MARALIALLCTVLFGGELPAAGASPATGVETRPQFVLVLTGGSEAAPDLAAYGATKVDQWYDRIFIRISDEQARELSKHPRVRFVQRMLEAGERRDEQVVAEDRVQAKSQPTQSVRTR